MRDRAALIGKDKGYRYAEGFDHRQTGFVPAAYLSGLVEITASP
jgi:hypothetical protein